jgi:hypothetical protein
VRETGLEPARDYLPLGPQPRLVTPPYSVDALQTNALKLAKHLRNNELVI